MDELWIAILSLFGTGIGTFGGIYTTSKLTSFRLKSLEEKLVEFSKTIAEIPVMKEQIKNLRHENEWLKQELEALKEK